MHYIKLQSSSNVKSLVRKKKFCEILDVCIPVLYFTSYVCMYVYYGETSFLR